jgi:hypothetical protein
MSLKTLKGAGTPVLALFTSVSTLVCCALPALFVTLGMGAVTAGLVSAVPQIVFLSEHKSVIFTVAGLMLVIALYAVRRSRNDPCPIDPVEAQACKRVRKLSKWILFISIFAYVVGFFFAFLAADIFY